ncbi:MAG TPA: amidohydrolase family protein [Phycisphaerales bacterium]|nr:amidohydrolase family protein [Phycisphaerales bacterium]HMP36738.1 amidohydrolase family protein [Phycisphaerales bacterium]
MPSEAPSADAKARPRNASNLHGIDYAAAAATLPRLGHPIIDVHAHIHGSEAARLYREVAGLYGIGSTWTMTALEQIDSVTEALQGRLRLIAVPDFMDPDRREAHGRGFLRRIEAYRARGCRLVKLWSAPRGLDLGRDSGDPDLLRLDGPARVEAAALATSLGMGLMVHVADPDTWFATRYADIGRYGTKRSHLEALERMLERFPGPWLAAHMAGWPEDLEFLDGLLERHPALRLDCSAAKWMIRELSRHEPGAVAAFLWRHRGRILFGSDTVTSDEHFAVGASSEMAAKSASRGEAFDLYASRYWAYRTLFESDVELPSPIADPDLAMIDPARFGPMDAPMLRGCRLSEEVLRSLYHDAAVALAAELDAL